MRAITQSNGYPGTAGTSLNADGSLWLNPGYVLPLHSRMEFWSERDGLQRNVSSMLHLGNRVFAICADSVRVLNASRSGWNLLVKLSGAASLLAGPDGTILVGSHGQGVMQIDRAGRVLRRSSPATITTLIRASDGSFRALGDTVLTIGFSGNRLTPSPTERRFHKAREAI